MNRSRFTPFVIVIGSLVIFLATSIQCFAGTISGIVIDEKGEPVPDIPVSIKSFKGTLLPKRHNMHRQEQIFPPPQPSNTDATGAFSIENISAPSVNRLTLFHGRQSEYEIRGIEMQGIAFHFHPHQFFLHEGIPFGIEEETDIKDVKITVRLRMRIRGQVLAADGSPLSNARVNLRLKRRYVDGGGGSSSSTTTLDADGYFVEYINRNRSTYYTVSVTYQGQSVESKEILLEEGQRLDGLTLTLGGEPEVPPKPKVVKAVPIRDPGRMQAMWKRRQEGVWAINPANRHAYKRIDCQTPDEALAQATAQGAHLVAINNAAEQQWLLDVYGKENYWIGFTDGLKQGDKKWDNGDPITYTSWDTQKLLSAPKKLSEKDENTSKTFTVLIGVTGKWQQVRADNPVASITEKAILEKADMIIGVQEPDEGAE